MAEEVSSIGVKLSLDAQSFMTGMAAATTETNNFVAAVDKASTVAGGSGAGKKTGSKSSAAQNVSGVSVDLSVSAETITKLRKQIIAGLGTITVPVTAEMQKTARAEAKGVVAATATPVIGTRSGARHSVDSTVKQNAPNRQYGGPVQQGRPYVVGERRPEVFVPASRGTIVPNIEEFRRREIDAAKREGDRERQHQLRMETLKRRPPGIRFQYEDNGIEGPGRIASVKATQRARGKGYTRSLGEAYFEQSERLGGWYPSSAAVRPGVAGRGIGSWMYATAEQHLGDFIHPSDIQSRHAQRMWTDPRRPFGGDRDAVPGQIGMFGPARRWPHRMAGGPVEPQGPLQRRLAGLPPLERPQPAPPPQPAWEPEWMRRARESKLPPKTYRRRSGPVVRRQPGLDENGWDLPMPEVPEWGTGWSGRPLPPPPQSVGHGHRGHLTPAPAGFPFRPSRRAGGGSVDQFFHARPQQGFLDSAFSTAASWANDPFMAYMSWQGQQGAKKARRGDVVGKPRLARDFAGSPMSSPIHSYYWQQQGPRGAAGPMWREAMSASPYQGMRAFAIDKIPDSFWERQDRVIGQPRVALPWMQDQKTTEQVARSIGITRHIRDPRPHMAGGPVRAQKGHLDITPIEPNLRSFFAGATPAQRAEGADWYASWGAKLKAEAKRLGLDPKLLTSVTASLSPNNGWPGNFNDAIKYAEAWRNGLPMPPASTFGTNQRKAWDILQHQSADFLKGLKVQPFGAALLGDVNAKPQDIWMKRAAVGDLSLPRTKGTPSQRQRREMDRVIDEIAAEQKLEPRQVQAIIWTAAREQGMQLAGATKHARLRMAGGPVHASKGTWLKSVLPLGSPETNLKKAGKSYAINAPGQPKKMVAGRLEYDSIGRPKKMTTEQAIANIEAHNAAMEAGPAVTYMHGKPPPEVPPEIAAKERQPGEDYGEFIHRELTNAQARDDLRSGAPTQERGREYPWKASDFDEHGGRRVPRTHKFEFEGEYAGVHYTSCKHCGYLEGGNHGFEPLLGAGGSRRKTIRHRVAPEATSVEATQHGFRLGGSRSAGIIPRPSREAGFDAEAAAAPTGDLKADAERAIRELYDVVYNGYGGGNTDARDKANQALMRSVTKRLLASGEQPAWVMANAATSRLPELTEAQWVDGVPYAAGAEPRPEYATTAGPIKPGERLDEFDLPWNPAGGGGRHKKRQILPVTQAALDLESAKRAKDQKDGFTGYWSAAEKKRFARARDWLSRDEAAHGSAEIIAQRGGEVPFPEANPDLARMVEKAKNAEVLTPQQIPGAERRRWLGVTGQRERRAFESLGTYMAAHGIPAEASYDPTVSFDVPDNIRAVYESMLATVQKLSQANNIGGSIGNLEHRSIIRDAHARNAGQAQLAADIEEAKARTAAHDAEVADAMKRALAGDPDPYRTPSVPQHEAPEVIAHSKIAEDALARRAERDAEQARIVAEARAAQPIEPRTTVTKPTFPRSAEDLLRDSMARRDRKQREALVERARDAGLLTVTRRTRAAGGDVGNGLYIVNEAGPEAFIENKDVPRLAANRPDILARVPHAADGARTGMIQRPAWSMYAPQKDGIIVRREDAHQALHAVRAEDGSMRADQDRFAAGPLWTPGQQPVGPPSSLIDRFGNVISSAAMKAAAAMDRMTASASKAATGLAPRQQAAGLLEPGPSIIYAGAPEAPAIPMGVPGGPAGRAPFGVGPAPVAGLLEAGTTIYGNAPSRRTAATEKARLAAAGLPPGERLYGFADSTPPFNIDQAREAHRATMAAGVPAYGEAAPEAPKKGKKGKKKSLADKVGNRHEIAAQSLTTEELQQLMSEGLEGAAGLDETQRAAYRFGQVKATEMRLRKGGRSADDIVAEARQKTAGVASYMPGRTARGAAAVLGETIFGGGRAFKQRQAEYQFELSATNRAASRVDTAEQRRDAAKYAVKEAKRTGADTAPLLEVLNDKEKTLTKTRKNLTAQVEKLDKAEKAIQPTTGNVVKSFGSIVLATSAYGAAFSAANMVISEGAVPAAKKLIDQFLGFAPTMTLVTNALADSTREMGGNYKAAIAAKGVTSGMSASTEDWVSSILDSTVVAKAGAKAYGDFSESFKATIGAMNSATGPQGLYGGYGGILGTPLMGEQLGGGMGLQEQMLKDVLAARGETGINLGKYAAQIGGGAGIGAGLASLGGPIGTGTGAAIGGAIGSLGLIGDILNGTVTADFDTSQRTIKSGTSEAAFQQNIQDAMVRAQERSGGPGYQFEYRGMDAFKAYENADVPQAMKNLAKAGYAVVDAQGKMVTGFNAVTDATEQLAEGLTIPDVEVWVKTVERGINAQFQMMDISSLVNREITIPLQAAMGRIASPLLQPGVGLVPGASRMGGLKPGEAEKYFSAQPTTTFGKGGVKVGGGMGLGKGLSKELAGWLDDAAILQGELADMDRVAIDRASAQIMGQPGAEASRIQAQTGLKPGTMPSVEVAVTAQEKLKDQQGKTTSQLVEEALKGKTIDDLMAEGARHAATSASQKPPQMRPGSEAAAYAWGGQSPLVPRPAPTTPGPFSQPQQNVTKQMYGPPTPPGLQEAADYRGLMAEAQTASKELAGLQTRLGALSVAASQATWANTTRLALRGIADASDLLSGKSSQAAGSLGAVQRHLWNISRASQALDLKLQGLQINFQESLAGFQAPGITSEERAARQAMAQIEADVARKKLGYSKDTYTESGQEWKIQAKRNLQDAQAAWDASKKAHRAEVASAAAQDKIARLSAKIAVKLQQAGDIYGTSSSKFETSLKTAGNYAETFGGVLRDATGGMTSFLSALGFTFTPKKGGGYYVGKPTFGPQDAGQGSAGYYGLKSSGYMGAFAGGATFTVGEAGTETVAILRNPRTHMMGGGGMGGGGGSMVVNLNVIVQGDVKDEATVAKITRAVEDSLNRKAARLGMRTLVSATG